MRWGAKEWWAFLIIAGFLSVCAPVRAQEVTAKGVGTIGGIIAGAEVVLVTESIIRVKPFWPYLVFPALGAVAGGIGGHKLEQKARGGAIALLVTSMVGAIPTIIGVASARAFHPEDVGAKRGDQASPQPSFGFQPSGDAGSTNELESQPEGLPTGPPAPPPPFYNGSDSDEQIIDSEMPPQSRYTPSSENAERLAHLSSGALFHLNRHLRLGMGIPAVDVLPISLSTRYQYYRGMEVYVPLLAFDLP